MSEVISKASEALAAYPLWNAIFLVAVVVAGFYLRILAQRERRMGVTDLDMPVYLLIHDAFKNIEKIAAELKLTNELLEDIRNNQEMRSNRKGP